MSVKIEHDVEDGDDNAALDVPQYAEWGVVVQTKDVRAAHVANGIMQLLRLMPSPPPWDRVRLEPAPYVKSIKTALDIALPSRRLSDEARALSVCKSQAGPIRLDEPSTDDSFKFVEKGRAHLDRVFGTASVFSEAAHHAIADALNADRRVMASIASDPTTTGLAFAGFTDTHTLKGMHAATFLGLLCASPAGRDATMRLYDAARSTDDPHSSLVCALDLAEKKVWPQISSPAFEGAFPVPPGKDWSALAVTAGAMASNITRRQEHGATKAETLMSLVDLALLTLATRMLRWERDCSPSRLLLTLCSRRKTTGLQQAIARAQESLRRARLDLDHEARGDGPVKTLIRGKKNKYLPSVHAAHLAAAGGWLFPLNAHGGAQQYFCPGPRQLVTLAHAVLPPGDEMPWPEFVATAERAFGLALGGSDDGQAEVALRMGGAAATLREAARTNQEQFVALGLARRESDNVVIVDGGAR
jgi:hypothetical protein